MPTMGTGETTNRETMASRKAAADQQRSTRQTKNPVDIALDAGTRPMLIGHEFKRKTKRYYVRETSSAVQYVAISPPRPRDGYLSCLHNATAGIISKEILNIAQELKINALTYIYIKHTDHDCHAQCQLYDISRFNARIDVDKIKRTPFFLRPFTSIPMIYDHIPEMREFGALCRRIDSSPSSYLTPKWAETYAIQHAQLLEKYLIPWFDQCDDMKYLAKWIEYWVGKRAKSSNLLLATACCLASEFDAAKTILKRVVDKAELPLDKIYRKAYRYERKKKALKTREDQKRRAEEFARAISANNRKKADEAGTLARYFGINLD